MPPERLRIRCPQVEFGYSCSDALGTAGTKPVWKTSLGKLPLVFVLAVSDLCSLFNEIMSLAQFENPQINWARDQVTVYMVW
jgi:hypothetical protein